MDSDGNPAAGSTLHQQHPSDFRIRIFFYKFIIHPDIGCPCRIPAIGLFATLGTKGADSLACTPHLTLVKLLELCIQFLAIVRLAVGVD